MAVLQAWRQPWVVWGDVSVQLQQETGYEVCDLQAPILDTSTAGGRLHKVEAGPTVAEGQQHREACGGQCRVGGACQAVLHPARRSEAEALNVMS